ncbi:MAG: type III pantothenate kinase, partial [Victivallales bacterium]|nr:type III pantothenate kinase [Victivallales bacterium]
RKVLTAELDIRELPVTVPVAAATVVPELRSRLDGRDIFWLEAGCECGLDLGRVDSRTTGADRLANLIALAAEYPLPALCIDFGTAITFEMLDRGKVFCGGAILPGRSLMRKALHEHTAQLPPVPLDIPPPERPGTNTVGQMALGIDVGLCGAVRELIAVMRREAGENLRVVAAGGDAGFFVKRLSGLEYAGDDFTLKGILKAWEMCRCR